MGNLSCVSCKVKDKKIQKSIEELALSDYKGASFNQDAICDATKHREDTGEPGRLSAQDLYETLKSRQLHPDDDDDKLDDIEKAAKAIVDMSVFLTTQIIYPAYLRYLREDHPDVYTQYFERPTTPLPTHYISADEPFTVDILDLRDVQPCLSCTEDQPLYFLESHIDTSICKKGDCR